MKKQFLFLIPVVLVATGLMVVSPGVAGKGLRAEASVGHPANTQATEEYSQPEPYTTKFFGPWNAAVANTHVPQVTLEKAGQGLKVTVQIDNHPMDPQKPHWIMWIRLEDMKGHKLGEKTFQPTDPRPAVAVFELPAMHPKLKALERCNIHGIWLNEVDVKLK
jgi:desulfoferrodoxin-like iron-binding protein